MIVFQHLFRNWLGVVQATHIYVIRLQWVEIIFPWVTSVKIHIYLDYVFKAFAVYVWEPGSRHFRMRFLTSKRSTKRDYRKIPNILGNKIVGHPDVVGASSSALLHIHLHFRPNTWLQWIGQRQLQGETRNINVLGFGAPCNRDLTVKSE